MDMRLGNVETYAFLNRRQRATGFFVYRRGDYLFLVPDRKHHFTKNVRPYIGRRR